MCFFTLPAHPLQCRDTLKTTTCMLAITSWQQVQASIIIDEAGQDATFSPDAGLFSWNMISP